MMLHKARISLGSITSRRCFASQENAASSKIKKLLEKEAPPAFGDRMIGLDPIGDRRPELFHPEGKKEIIMVFFFRRPYFEEIYIRQVEQ
jgi:hypothetical protein